MSDILSLNVNRINDTWPGRALAICFIIVITTTVAIWMQTMRGPPVGADTGAENLSGTFEATSTTNDSLLNSSGDPLPSAARSLVSSVTVVEGDVLVLGSISVQIENLDCASAATTHGALALEEARFLVHERELVCDLHGRMAASHAIGTCQLPDGRDFGDAMTSAGMCALSSW